MDSGGSPRFAGLPDLCSELCLRLARLQAPWRCAVLLRVVALMMLVRLELQTGNRFEVILGMLKALVFEFA